MSVTHLKTGYDIVTLVCEYVGLSTDTKPADAPNGSTFFEMDTGDKYYFDAETAQDWVLPGATP